MLSSDFLSGECVGRDGGIASLTVDLVMYQVTKQEEYIGPENKFKTFHELKKGNIL